MWSRALRTLVVIALGLSFGAVQAEGKQIYWTEQGSGRIVRAHVNGAGQQVLIDTGLTAPLGLALDPTSEKLYWTEATRIARANLDGSGVETLVPGLALPLNVVLDTGAGKMYWTEAGMVRRADLDGTNVETIYMGDGTPLGGLALDLSTGKLYVSTALGLILRMNLDGTNVETVVDLSIDSSPIGMALDADGGKLYWIEAFPFPKLGRSDLDGSDVQFIVPTAFDSFGIALDPGAAKVYFASGGIIHRANLDGTSAEELIFTGKEGPNGIALDLRTTGVTASMDVAPGSCPNAVSVRSHGVLPVAVLGSAALDVTEIDPSTIVLQRADGLGDTLAPDVRGRGKLARFDDVATPFAGDECGCHGAGADGVDDLLLHFRVVDVVEALLLESESHKAPVELLLSGVLFDGTPLEASDCITTIGK